MGTSSSKTHYEMMDQDPFSGVNYYRLQQVDLDGERRSYGPVSVRFDGTGKIRVHHDRKQGRIVIFNSGQESYSHRKLHLYDTRGRLIAEGELRKEGEKLSSDLPDLEKGIYFIHVPRPERNDIRKKIMIH
jgi:hypothetical protein